MKQRLLTIVVLILTMTATTRAAETFVSGNFKYEIASLSQTTYAYIKGMVSPAGIVDLVVPGYIEHSNGTSYPTIIDVQAFANNNTLKNVTVEYGCAVIQGGAFMGCPNLQTLRLPSTIVRLWNGIVNGCTNGITVYMAKGTIPPTSTSTWQGINKSKSKFYCYSQPVSDVFAADASYNDFFGSIRREPIPQYACDYTVGNNCFVVTQPSTTSEPGKSMLVGTTYSGSTPFAVNLTTANTNYTMLGDYAVTHQPTRCTKVMESAFLNAPIGSFSSTSNYVEEIGENAFYLCHNLTTFTFTGTNARLISYDACRECEALTTVITNVREIYHHVFDGCVNLTSVTLQEGVRQLHSGVFSGCNALTSIHLPASLYISIDRRSLYCGSYLDHYEFEIPHYAGFNELPNLQTITVASGNPYYSAVDNVLYDKNQETLYFCARNNSVSNITIPKTLKTIKTGAFREIVNTSLNTIELPFGVETIEKGAFVISDYIKNIRIPSSVTNYDIKSIFFCGDRSMQVCSLGFSTFSETPRFGIDYEPKNLYLQAGTHEPSTEFGHVHMDELYEVKNNLDVVSYGAYDVLTDDGIPLILNASTKTAKVVYGRFKEDHTAKLYGTVVIPETYTYNGVTYTVTEIDMHAFEGNTKIRNLKIPKTVTNFIGALANSYDGAEDDGCQFKGCTALTDPDVPYGVKNIPNRCFYGSGLITADMPYGAERIGYQAFANCKSMTELRLPSSITAIAPTFISGCSKMKQLYVNTRPTVAAFSGSGYFSGVPKTCVLNVPVGESGNYRADSGWSYFSTIAPGAWDFGHNGRDDSYMHFTVISANGTSGTARLVYRDADAAKGLSPDISQKVSDGMGRTFTVTELGDSCLAGATLTAITLPSTITRIGKQAMQNTTALKTITAQMTTLPTLGANVWQGINQSGVQLFYPDGMYEDYKAADQWKNFFMEEELVTYDLTVNGTKVTSRNKNNIPVDAGSAVYDPNTKTLTLNNVLLDCAAKGEEYYPLISSIDGITINFVGNCHITGAVSYGMTLWGNGTTLNVTGTTRIDCGDSGYSFDGMVVDGGDVWLKGGGLLDIEVDDGGIYTRNVLHVTDTQLKVKCGRKAFEGKSQPQGCLQVSGANGSVLLNGVSACLKDEGWAGLTIEQPAGAHYDATQKAIADASGNILKSAWLLIKPAADGVATGISEASILNDEQADTYNLQGQRVARDYKGVVIMNGRKYVRR